ncbi:MAG: hypothetical protein ACK5YR_22815, partial [Pirellula sp.]
MRTSISRQPAPNIPAISTYRVAPAFLGATVLVWDLSLKPRMRVGVYFPTVPAESLHAFPVF